MWRCCAERVGDILSAAVSEPVPARGGAYDYRGRVRVDYRPQRDREADPGEVVWSWVAFEDDPRIGKDRPLAIVGWTDDARLVGLMMSSRDHSEHRNWVAIGAGPWDRHGRSSWVRIDRVLAVDPAAVRREGAVLTRRVHARIVREAQRATANAISRPGLLKRTVTRLIGR